LIFRYPDSVKKSGRPEAVVLEATKSPAELCRICGSFLTANLKRPSVAAYGFG